MPRRQGAGHSGTPSIAGWNALTGRIAPTTPPAARQFMTHWELGVCDGDGKEVGNETIADALNAVAAIQFAWGYWKPAKAGGAT